MSAYTQAIRGWVRHERDRALRASGQAPRYLNDALFHAALDVALNAVEITGEALAKQTDDPVLTENVVRATVYEFITAQARMADLRTAMEQTITRTPLLDLTAQPDGGPT